MRATIQKHCLEWTFWLFANISERRYLRLIAGNRSPSPRRYFQAGSQFYFPGLVCISTYSAVLKVPCLLISLGFPLQTTINSTSVYNIRNTIPHCNTPARMPEQSPPISHRGITLYQESASTPTSIFCFEMMCITKKNPRIRHAPKSIENAK